MFVRTGNVVEIIKKGSFTLSADGVTLSVIVPEGFRPYYYYVQQMVVYNGSTYVDCQISVAANGIMTIKNLLGQPIANIQTQYLCGNTIVFLAK